MSNGSRTGDFVNFDIFYPHTGSPFNYPYAPVGTPPWGLSRPTNVDDYSILQRLINLEDEVNRLKLAEQVSSQEYVDELRQQITCLEDQNQKLIQEIEQLRKACKYIKPYLIWTVDNEDSPGHHPTMSSAVGQFLHLTGLEK